MKTNQQPRGFSLVELVVVCVVVAVVCAMAWPGARLARSQAGLAGSLANLKKIGEGTGAYAADYDDQFWAFSWKGGDTSSQYEDLRLPNGDVPAHMYQSVDIARRLSGRDEIPRYDNNYKPLYLSTLVLADFLQDSLPAEWSVSPGDKARLGWAADPGNPPDLGIPEIKDFAATFGPYGSSYMLMPAFIAPDEKVGRQDTIYQYKPEHDLMWIPGWLKFGGRRVSEVLFPAQKVHMAERASFFFGPTPTHYLHAEARVPVLMVDGSATPRASADANDSFLPNQPYNLNRTSVTNYKPNLIYEPPTLSGDATDNNVETHYKWTRRGLRGVDFNGQRVE